MKKLPLGYAGPDQFDGLTPAEREAWAHPEPHSYHSFHIERMGEHIWRWRDSREGNFYIGSLAEFADAILTLRLRRLDPHYENHVTTLRLLSQEEVDDLLSEL